MLELEATLARLTNDYQKAIEEKMRCQREADETTKTIQLANSKIVSLTKIKYVQTQRSFANSKIILPIQDCM